MRLINETVKYTAAVSIVKSHEKEYIEAVLRRTQWNVSRAAQLLDLQRTYLHEKMTALGITRRE
ncbi:MAG: helix-turn-helix domain-containing protein [Acidobacteriota bacterium]